MSPPAPCHKTSSTPDSGPSPSGECTTQGSLVIALCPYYAGIEVAIVELQRPLGRHADGQMYLGSVLTTSGRRGAVIRIFHPDAEAAAGELEAVVRRAQHPGVVRMIDAGHDPRFGRFLAFDAVRGRTLLDLVGFHWPPDSFSLHVIRELTIALIAMHEAGLVVRHLSPSTILLTVDGRVLLLPPGVADTALAYLSPEQIRGEALTTASDLFNLGVVAAELLTRAHPFARPGASEIQLLQAIIAGVHPPWGPELSAPLAERLDALLDLHPDRRPTAAQLFGRMAAICPDFREPRSRRRCRHLVAQAVTTGRFGG